MMRTSWLVVSIALAALFFPLAASTAEAAYAIPSGHPRILITPASVATLAERCKVGGSHRAYYEKMLAFADSRIGASKTDGRYLPNYALVYLIHKRWNETAYQGGGFEESKYWSFTRQSLLSSGSWGIDSDGASRAMAADWIFDKLSAADIATIAPKYGTPMTYIPDSQTWRDATTYNRLTSLFRSLLYAGSGVDTGSYSTEYQEVCENIELYLAPALNFQGGVGSTGPMYETQLQFDRAWMIEAFAVATGIDGWDLVGKWKEEWGKWLVYTLVPHRGRHEPNQDVNSATSGDSYKNVALMAARGQDPYGQAHNIDYWQDVQTRDISDYRNTSLWCLVLWYDTALPAHVPSTSPKAVRLGAGGMDHVYMTTGLGPSSATWACFEAGKYLYGHQHPDAGSFTIHRKGNLIIDSGFYAQYRSVDGDDHSSSYYHRSIAHNVVHVYDPNEPFYWTSGGGICQNDGGQVMPSSAPSLAEASTDPTFSPGEMLRYETNESYTYSQADLANAYDQVAISESRNKPDYPNKLTHITREFVYLRPNYFVVFDRVGSVDPNFVKVWNAHVAADPVIQGSGVQRAGGASAGIWDYAGASVAKVTDPDPRYQQGSLFLKALLPKNRTMRKIGGNSRSYDGYAYWVRGLDPSGRYDPTKGEYNYWVA
ncbi:MAG: hypothetical protein EHM19_00660, partial [Candidatus Latescibacterota bacterium]